MSIELSICVTHPQVISIYRRYLKCAGTAHRTDIEHTYIVHTKNSNNCICFTSLNKIGAAKNIKRVKQTTVATTKMTIIASSRHSRNIFTNDWFIGEQSKNITLAVNWLWKRIIATLGQSQLNEAVSSLWNYLAQHVRPDDVETISKQN